MRRAPLLVALFLAALALRPQLVGIGPLLPSIQDDLGITHAVAGLLGTIPVLCMGLFAPPAPFLSGRIGSRRAIAVALALIGVFGVLRAIAPGAVAVIVLTFPIGVGMGLAGALLPVAVKERFADRPRLRDGRLHGGYHDRLGDRGGRRGPAGERRQRLARTPLLVFGAVSVGLAVVWVWLTRAEQRHVRARGPAAEAPVSATARVAARRRVLLHVVGLLRPERLAPGRLRRARLDRGSTGALLAVLNTVHDPRGLSVALVGRPVGGRDASGLPAPRRSMLVALLGIVLLPVAGWAWAVCSGPRSAHSSR